MSDYLAFSPVYLYHIMNMLRANIGAIFTVAIYTFFIVLCIYNPLYIISSIGQLRRGEDEKTPLSVFGICHLFYSCSCPCFCGGMATQKL